jgi:hypothetical protein
VARTATAALAPASGDPAIAELVSRANQLKERFEAKPELKIPELALLGDGDWLDVARERSVDSDADLRASLGRIRAVAKSKFVRSLIQGLSTYVTTYEGRLPAAAHDLQSHVNVPIEPAALSAILARYEIKPSGSITQVPDRAILILEREQALIDRDYDTQLRISRALSDRDAPFKINTVQDSVPGRLAPVPPRYLR